jgi:hypothetical protein
MIFGRFDERTHAVYDKPAREAAQATSTTT